jgi:hypothetical protein
MLTQDLKIESWRIERLTPYARNARLHSDAQVAQIAASIAEFGFNNPVLVEPSGWVNASLSRCREIKALCESAWSASARRAEARSSR